MRSLLGEDCVQQFDPDLAFKFNDVNTDQIRDLLIGLNQEKFTSSEVSKLVIFDVFTNIIIEALQFLGFIPYAMEGDIEEVSMTYRASKDMQEHYLKMNGICQQQNS